MNVDLTWRPCLTSAGLGAVLAAVSLGVAACAPAAAPSPTAAPAKPAEVSKAAAPAQPTAAPIAKPTEKPAEKVPAKPVQKVALKSAYTTTSATMAPLWGAKEGGFFDEEGLDVSLSRIQAGGPILGAMQGGDVPIAFVGAQQIVEANAKGASFVIVAMFFDQLAQQIYVNKSIERPDQLKGKALGVTNFGAITHVATRVALKHWGLSEKDVTVLATGGPPETLAAMQAGRIAGAAFSPPDAFKARDAGYRLLLDMRSIHAPSGTAAIATTRKWANEKPELVERYIRAAIKGSHAIKTNKALGFKALGNYSGIKDEKILADTYDYYKDLWLKDGLPTQEAIQANIDIAAEEIPEAKNLKFEQVVDLTWWNKVKASGLIEQLWGKSGY